jgi:DNA-binding NarL/FixJ family response regulator
MAEAAPVQSGQSAGPRFIRSANPVKARTPLTEQVLELSRNGFSIDTIAARLGVTQAEVDLALAMSERPSSR